MDNNRIYKIAVVMSTYNGEKFIAEQLDSILNQNVSYNISLKILVRDDCSTDNTLQILKEHDYNYVSLPINLGIGGAVQTGYKYAEKYGYDIAVQVDGDGQHDPAYLSQLVETMQKEDADMVIGSRFINKEGFQSSFARRVGINYFSHLIKQLTGKTITDPTSGFRLANRRVIALFAQDYPRDYPEHESIVALLKRGLKVVEAPVVMKERQGGQSSIRLQNSIYYMIKVTIAILIENMRKYL